MALRLFGETAALRDFDPAYVRFGSKADIGGGAADVRFTPKSGHRNSVVECPLCAKSGHWLTAWESCQRAVAVIRSVELIVQPDAKDVAAVASPEAIV